MQLKSKQKQQLKQQSTTNVASNQNVLLSPKNNQPQQSQNNQNMRGADQIKNTVNINMDIMNIGMPNNLKNLTCQLMAANSQICTYKGEARAKFQDRG